MNLNIDGFGAQAITFVEDPGTLGDTLTLAKGGGTVDVDATVDYLNNLFDTQAAGSGVTASNVGGQIVLSSDSGGSVVVTQDSGGTPPEAAGVMSSASALNAEAVESVAGVAGTAVTGDFNVDADGNFLSESGELSPLTVTAGENDTFSVAIDGGAAQDVTIAAGTYDSLADLSSAINSGIAASAATITGPDLSAMTGAAFDLSTNSADNLNFTATFNGSTASATINADGNYNVGTDAENREALRAALQADFDAELGTGQVTVSLNANNELEFATVDPNDTLVLGSDADNFNGGADTFSGGSTIPSFTASVSAGNQSLTFTSGTANASSAVDLTNGTFAIEGGFTNGARETTAVTPNALESGDLVINGTSIRAALASDDTASNEVALTSDAAASGIATAAAINASSEQTGVTATVNATTLNGGDGTGAKAASGSGTIYINDVSANISLTGDYDADRTAAVDAINAMAGQTGVTAEDNGKSITLTAEDGRNISVAIDNQGTENFGAAIGLDSSVSDGIGEADMTNTAATYANTAGTTYSTVKLESAGEIEISSGNSGPEELEALGLKVGSYGAGENGSFISDIDISTFEGANDAIVAIDNALQQVSAERANLGAIQNRFESTISNLAITSENLTAANSRIQDADFAAETAALSRSQVLQQAGISVLAQANALPQQALSLLQ